MAAKKRHPAGKRLPAKAPAKAAAKKAPAAKAPARKAPAKATGPKLRWQVDGERSEVGKVGQSAAFGGGTVAIEPTGDGGFRATYTEGKRVTKLADGVSFGKAYAAVRAYVEGVAA